MLQSITLPAPLAPVVMSWVRARARVRVRFRVKVKVMVLVEE